MTDEIEKQQKLIQIVKDAITDDQALRDKYKVGDKFRFIRDHLQELLNHLEKNIHTLQKADESKTQKSAPDEVLVYVYLFNAQGLNILTWLRMLSPSVFYEYSINRPIYLDKSHIEAVIRNKQNRAQHGYIVVAIKTVDLIQNYDMKDPLGQPLAKIREGSLRFDRLVDFFTNEHSYTVDEDKGLIKKE